MRASTRLVLLVAAIGIALAPVAASAHSLSEGDRDLRLPTRPWPADPLPEVVADGFELVGHSPLGNRGMNAAPAIHGDYVYVGSRTDGWPHRDAGIHIVDVSDPTAPEVVGSIDAPAAANLGESSRELRVWPERDLLIVLNHGCSSIIHACLGGEVGIQSQYRLFDISGDKATAPELMAIYEPSISGQGTPHEFFLWVDPSRPDKRALLFQTTPTTSSSAPSLLVTDLSGYELNLFPELSWAADFPAMPLPNGELEDRRLHSITVSNDGTRTYLAFLGAGFLVLDSSEVTAGVPDAGMELVTPPEKRVAWTNPGAHSAVKLWGQDAALITDEVYGDLVTPIAGGTHGCPWGWVRTIDITDETAPALHAEYKLAENDPAYCDDPVAGSAANTYATSYSAHNPTVTPNLAFVTWHSSGLAAFTVTDPAAPEHAGRFKPFPLPAVVTEDPALSYGVDKVVMWSFPIIVDGLIYVIDLRNGLYILRYTGPHADEVEAISFLEGNSNLGDALVFEPVSEERMTELTAAPSTASWPAVAGFVPTTASRLPATPRDALVTLGGLLALAFLIRLRR